MVTLLTLIIRFYFLSADRSPVSAPRGRITPGCIENLGRALVGSPGELLHSQFLTCALVAFRGSTCIDSQGRGEVFSGSERTMRPSSMLTTKISPARIPNSRRIALGNTTCALLETRSCMVRRSYDQPKIAVTT